MNKLFYMEKKLEGMEPDIEPGIGLGIKPDIKHFYRVQDTEHIFGYQNTSLLL